MKIRIKSTDRQLLEKTFLYWIDKGYVLVKAYTIKRPFSLRKYVVKLEESQESYQIKINEAIANENYEEAKKLTAEFEKMKILKF